jgi:hypothetical protein
LAAFLIPRAIPRGALGAVKIAHTGHSGQLGSAPKDVTIPSSSPRRLLVGTAKRRGEICPSNYFRVFLGHARFGFLVKKIFSAIKNKIHFFLVDFETGF